MLRLEELETRFAPALLMSAMRVDYIDGDNDRIAIISNTPIFEDVDVANAILAFSNATLVEDDNDITNDFPDTLQTLNLAAADPDLAANANIQVKLVSRGAGGDGFAGLRDGSVPGLVIDASGLPLGKVNVRGDLSQITVGDGSVAVQELNVQSYGRYNASVVESIFTGNVGTLKVVANVSSAQITVDGGISALQIGGSLVGTDDPDSGRINATNDITSVRVTGSILGGGGTDSAQINSAARIINVFVGGSVKGGTGDNSGIIQSDGSMGPVRVVGSLIGGTSDSVTFTGIIRSNTDNINSVSIGGSIVGGAGGDSGEILSPGSIGSVRVGKDVLGGNGIRSGRIHADGDLGPVSVFGSLKGNVSPTALSTNNGEISCFGNMSAIGINGDIVGGAAQMSGLVYSGGTMGAISVGKSLLSGGELFAGGVFSMGDITSVRVGKNIDGTRAITQLGVGNIGAYSAAIVAGVTVDPTVDAGILVMSSTIDSASNASIGTVNIGGTIKGGVNGSTTQVQGPNALVFATGSISVLKIFGSVEGGVSADPSDPSGYIQAKRLPSIYIGGSVKAPVNSSTPAPENSAAIRAVYDIGDITVKGSLVGNATNRVSITAFGEEDPISDDKAFGDTNPDTDVAIRSISVFGSVSYTDFLAGYQVDSTFSTFDVTAQNDGASIGKFDSGEADGGGILVNGNFTASNVVAGASKGADGFFGSLDDGTSSDDEAISGSRTVSDFATDPTLAGAISAIVIKGVLAGSTGSSLDSYGFVANADLAAIQSVISFKYGNQFKGTSNATPTPSAGNTITPPAEGDAPVKLGPSDVFLVNITDV